MTDDIQKSLSGEHAGLISEVRANYKFAALETTENHLAFLADVLFLQKELGHPILDKSMGKAMLGSLSNPDLPFGVRDLISELIDVATKPVTEEASDLAGFLVESAGRFLSGVSFFTTEKSEHNFSASSLAETIGRCVRNQPSCAKQAFSVLEEYVADPFAPAVMRALAHCVEVDPDLILKGSTIAQQGIARAVIERESTEDGTASDSNGIGLMVEGCSDLLAACVRHKPELAPPLVPKLERISKNAQMGIVANGAFRKLISRIEQTTVAVTPRQNLRERIRSLSEPKAGG